MYRKPSSDVVKELYSDVKNGLNTKDLPALREKHGKNQLEEHKKETLLVKFFKEFADVLIIILLIAAVVSLIVDIHEWVDAVVIFVVVILNAILGVIQEARAEKSLEALKKMSSPECKVIRNGVTDKIPSSELVVGDIILIEAGDYIPADARLIDAVNLQVDESALTGESVPVTKITEEISGDATALGDRKNMVFSSTFVTSGRGKAVVTDIGMKTEIGKIAGMLGAQKSEPTPLQHKLAQVGKVIGIISIFICLGVFALDFFLLNGMQASHLVESFKLAVALAVAAIPEGLATVVTIVLAIGVSKMVKENAIVKKLPAVETLGSTSIVCSDKTGTLTQNKMTVLEIYNGNLKLLSDITPDDAKLLNYFSICCDAKIEVIDGVEKRIGDPTETALVELNNKYGTDISWAERVGEIPFDSDRKLMTVIIKENGKYISITKGAPDVLLKRLATDKGIEDINVAIKNMSERALRVLALGIKVFDEMPVVDDNLEKDLTFVGLAGMIDPPRPEVLDAIKVAKRAGVRTIMITGDNIITATAIARQLGIMDEGQRALASDELDAMDDNELRSRIEEFSVYARVAPKDKVRIVEAWQAKGKVVAMTGDGVNDSPALKKADIGCAMGITGTDVSKEAADMILTDDNFTTIIKSVKQGRGIYANIRKCVKYLLSSNIGEVLVILLAEIIAAFGWVKGMAIPLASIHLLWINLVTDSLPAFGLGMEKPEDSVMLEKPRPKNENFFAQKLGLHIGLEGVIVGLLTLTSYVLGVIYFGHAVASTMAFITLAFTQLFHSYNVKSDSSVISKSAFDNKFLNFAFIAGAVMQLAVVYIPGINAVFQSVALNITQLGIALGCAFGIVIVMEIYKFIVKLIKKNK
ncbi:MAG: calcium-translocating P-type ATPase, PMCA-type [Clostridia bacterium]|nr:calcium-translocating P-type ATPase, PMCA-type [Clostridia bacterium]